MVAQQPECLAQIAGVLIEEALRRVPVTQVGADVVVSHIHCQQLPVPLHVHMAIASQQIDEYASLEGQIPRHDHRLGDVKSRRSVVDHQAVAHRETVQFGIKDLQDVRQGDESSPVGQTATGEGQTTELVDHVDGIVGKYSVACGQGVAKGSYDVNITRPEVLYGSGRTRGACVVSGTQEGHLLGHRSLELSLASAATAQRLDVVKGPFQRGLPGVQEQMAQILVDVGVLLNAIFRHTGIVGLGTYSDVGQQAIGSILSPDTPIRGHKRRE